MAFPRIEDHQVISVDCESTGLEWYRGDRAFGVSVYMPATGDANITISVAIEMLPLVGGQPLEGQKDRQPQHQIRYPHVAGNWHPK